MRRNATDVARSVVYVSVWLCVGHTDEKNGWTDRDAVWGLGSVGPSNVFEMTYFVSCET